ncbi:MAG: hypothetical protein K2Q18_09310, partial [Bdellovibrionales bacterium]|nr:hypothetical protein [Bdellovibrionales bacterium]
KKILGGFIKEDAYDKSIALLERLGFQKIMPLAWDWRRDPIHGIRALDELVKKCNELYPDNKIILISHSFGSLIASYYLRYGAQDFSIDNDPEENWEGLRKFEKIILSAAPFRGLMAMFRNMHYGIKFGLNSNMQTPLAFSTFESSYYLLPPKGLDCVLNEEGKIESLGLHDPHNWEKYRFGLFHESCRPKNESLEEKEIRFKYIDHHLKRAQKFNQLIDGPIIKKPNVERNILYLNGFGQQTVHHGLWLKKLAEVGKPNVVLYYPKHFKQWKLKDKASIVYGDGDATVPDFSLKLPTYLQELQTKEVKRKLGHLDILQSQESQEIITNFLSE